MAKEARGLICLALTAGALRAARPRPDGGEERGAAADRLHGHDRGAPGRHAPASRAHDRAHTIQVAIDPRSGPTDIVVPGHIFPLRAKDGRRAGAHRPHRGQRRPRPARRPDPGRGDLRGDERRRHDGPRPRPGPLLRAARPEDDHGRRPDRLPAPHREAGRAGRRDRACRPRSATSPRSATARWSTTSTTWRWSRARSPAPRTCWSASTASASPATSSTACAATAASSSRRRWR